jgi:hypothetical protein
MSKLKPRDNYERSDGGLWLPRTGIVGPSRGWPNTRRMMPGYPCCCSSSNPPADCSATDCIYPTYVSVGSVGGFTASYCDCDDSGYYILTYQGYDAYTDSCFWNYSDADFNPGCGVGCGLQIYGGGLPPYSRGHVIFSWGYNYDGHHSSNIAYDGDITAGEGENCFPLTLSKQSYFTFGSCGATESGPATVAVEAA